MQDFLTLNFCLIECEFARFSSSARDKYAIVGTMGWYILCCLYTEWRSIVSLVHMHFPMEECLVTASCVS